MFGVNSNIIYPKEVEDILNSEMNDYPGYALTCTLAATAISVIFYYGPAIKEYLGF